MISTISFSSSTTKIRPGGMGAPVPTLPDAAWNLPADLQDCEYGAPVPRPGGRLQESAPAAAAPARLLPEPLRSSPHWQE